MNAKTEDRWAIAVRVMVLVATVSSITAVLEARAIRGLRSELQTLRSEREQAKAGVNKTWAAQSADEFGEALRWLNGFYGDTAEGFGRAGGLCAGGELNTSAIARFAVESFLPARAARRSMLESLDAMRTAIRRTDEYRAVHPDLALPDK